MDNRNKKHFITQYERSTEGANDFAGNPGNSLGDITLNWWECFSSYRVKKWRQELQFLSENTGIPFETVCEYIGVEISARPGFFRKLPKKRETYIAIGMAFRQPLETINRWLAKYGMKRKLYVKDIISDLIWIHLIEINCRYQEADINYFREYEACKRQIETESYQQWESTAVDDMGTVILSDKLKDVPYDPEHFELGLFVREHIDAFKTAYAKPRKMLRQHVDQILKTKNELDLEKNRWTLNSLRGYLDDSMINYLSGNYETVNKPGQVKGNVLGLKHIPKSKKAHIALCLALGMNIEEINYYLDLMGYAPLDGVDYDEGQLINLLRRWDKEHPLPGKYRRKYFNDFNVDANVAGENSMSGAEELEAVNQMLMMREDIKDVYARFCAETNDAEELHKKGNHSGKFPYMGD